MGPGLLFMSLVGYVYLMVLMGRGVAVGGWLAATLAVAAVAALAKCAS